MTMRFLGSWLEKWFPAGYPVVRNAWRGYRTTLSSRKLARLGHRLGARHSWRICGGPFAGMHYLQRACSSALLPKLVGCYEAELHSSILQLSRQCSSIMVDVGCAEGYYAVGLALLRQDANVFAFDTDPVARELCSTLARMNRVEHRVHVTDACSPDRLREVLQAQALVVCDVEGYELDLLRPDIVPQLRDCYIVVELHDAPGRDVAANLLPRFSSSHQITVIERASRNPDAYASLCFLAPSDRKLAVDELRGPQRWAVLVPNGCDYQVR